MSEDLFAAAASGNDERLRALLDRNPGAVHARDGDGATPLHYAALNGHRKAAQLLLEQGAEINARDGQFNATPAGCAIEHLREAGGVLGIEIDNLVFAVIQRDSVWVGRFLTRLPALARASDRNGKPLSEHAEESGDAEIVRLFHKALGKE